MNADWIFSLVDSTLRLACPLMLAAMGGLLAERSGTVDLALEGKMLAGAFSAAVVATLTGSAWAGLTAAMLAAVAVSMLLALATLRYRGDHVVTAVALNFLISGVTVVLAQAWFEMGGQTPALEPSQRFLEIVWPGAEWLGTHVPLLGPVFERAISGHSLFVYLAALSVPFMVLLFQQTRFGLRLRAVGEEPNAVDTAGVSVAKVRTQALIGSGIFCGLAGATMSLSLNAGFTRDMTAGAGYIALAAIIFGKWRPVGAAMACLLFGLLTALESRVQRYSLPLVGELPAQLLQALPYALTVILLAGWIGKATAPKALGRPYLKER